MQNSTDKITQAKAKMCVFVSIHRTYKSLKAYQYEENKYVNKVVKFEK